MSAARRAVVIAAPGDDVVTAARDRAARRLDVSGHEVTVVDLTGFDPVMGARELAAYRLGRPELDDVTAVHAAAVATATTVVFVFPTTLGTVPAVLKGWLDRVLVPGVAFTMSDDGRVRRGLRHLDRLVGITPGEPGGHVGRSGDDAGRRIIMRNVRSCTRLTTRARWVSRDRALRQRPEPVEHFLRRVERAVVA